MGREREFYAIVSQSQRKQLARREIQAALSEEYPVTESPKFSKLTLTLYSR